MLIIQCSRVEAQAIFMGKCAILASVVEQEATVDTIPFDVLESMFEQSERILGVQ